MTRKEKDQRMRKELEGETSRKIEEYAGDVMAHPLRSLSQFRSWLFSLLVSLLSSFFSTMIHFKVQFQSSVSPVVCLNDEKEKEMKEPSLSLFFLLQEQQHLISADIEKDARRRWISFSSHFLPLTFFPSSLSRLPPSFPGFTPRTQLHVPSFFVVSFS